MNASKIAITTPETFPDLCNLPVRLAVSLMDEDSSCYCLFPNSPDIVVGLQKTDNIDAYNLIFHAQSIPLLLEWIQALPTGCATLFERAQDDLEFIILLDGHESDSVKYLEEVRSILEMKLFGEYSGQVHAEDTHGYVYSIRSTYRSLDMLLGRVESFMTHLKRFAEPFETKGDGVSPSESDSVSPDKVDRPASVLEKLFDTFGEGVGVTLPPRSVS